MHAPRQTALRQETSRRRGYALMAVLLFSMVFMMLLGVASRHVASVVRTATVRVGQTHRDEGSMAALARSLKLLETGLPANGYVCCATISTSTGTRSYTVRFDQQADGTWSVSARPKLSNEDPPAMPTTFAL